MKKAVKVFAVVVAFLVSVSVNAQTDALVVLKSNNKTYSSKSNKSQVVEIKNVELGIINTSEGAIPTDDVSQVVIKTYSSSVHDLYVDLRSSGVAINFDRKYRVSDSPIKPVNTSNIVPAYLDAPKESEKVVDKENEPIRKVKVSSKESKKEVHKETEPTRKVKVSSKRAVIILKSNASAVVEIKGVVDGVIETSIGGVSSTDVSSVTFRQYSHSAGYLYAELAHNGVAVNFDRESELFYLPDTAENDINVSSFKETETYAKYTDSRKTGRRLMNASKSGIIGIALPIIGGGLAVATGGTLPVLIGGVAGIIFQIDAWSKVSQAGEVLDLELESLRNSKK